jgi:hypothetical protein
MGKGAISEKLDGANTEVCAAKIDGHVETLTWHASVSCASWCCGSESELPDLSTNLFGAIGHARDIRRNLAHAGPILAQTLVFRAC